MTDKIGKLIVIATPIGNLEDISIRAIRMLGEVDALACEDTRHTKILFDKFNITRPKIIFSNHEYNEDNAAYRILSLLRDGYNVGLCSNAGYPGISDPGYTAVNSAITNGYEVEVIPGASALPIALISSGLPVSSFTFKGFPPRKSGKRQNFMAIDKELPHTMIYYEAPTRVIDLLKDAHMVYGNRMAAVCIELTKIYEKIHRGTLSELIAAFTDTTIKGEVVIVIAGNNKKFIKEEDPDVR
ncbi:MAG: 16S rRNA (cytidine(1402)-2'-O)-methyltransferase [bacterium]